MGGKGGREIGEDIGKLGSQQRGGHMGGDEIEQVDGGRGRILVGDALSSDLAGKQ